MQAFLPIDSRQCTTMTLHCDETYALAAEEYYSEIPKVTFGEECGNCGDKGFFSRYCHSCSKYVCEICHVEDEGCCVDCLQTFPKSPHSSCGTPFAMQNVVSSMYVQPAQQCQWACQPVMPYMDGSYQMPVMPFTAPQRHRNTKLEKFQRDRFEKTDQRDRFEKTESKKEKEIQKEKAKEKVHASDCSTTSCSTSETGEKPTTMMVTNIPCRFGQEAIEEAIDTVGFAGTYDFVYIPKRNRNSIHEGNIGYAFVNFRDADDAERFVAAFQDFQFPGSKSLKRCCVKVAHQQGYNALVAAAEGQWLEQQRAREQQSQQ